MSRGQIIAEPERRRGTALFVDITGFTALNEQYDTEEIYGYLSECLQLLDEICCAHGGTVEKYLGDCIYALFGVPRALEEGPRLAVNAAIEMRERVARFNVERKLSSPLGIHTGINTGVVLSSDVIGSSHREHATMGDSVNVASRLKDLAPAGSIWIGHETYLDVRDGFDFRALGALEFKGKNQRVRAYEVLSRVPSRYHRPSRRAGVRVPLFGRDAELGRLRARIAQLRRGEGGVVRLVGAAGTGKSRLLEELEQSPEASAVNWLRGRSIAAGSNLSFHPFGDLLRAWIGVGEGDDDEASLQALERVAATTLGRDAAEDVPFVATLMGMRGRSEHRERLDALSGDATQRLIVKTMTRWLRALAEEGPLVLVFEDVHWADGSSIELLASLLRLAASQRVLFLLSSRPSDPGLPARLREALDALEAAHEEVVLGNLDRGSSEAFIAKLFEGGRAPASLLQQIEQRTGGNPFFIEEVVRSLVDEGVLVLRDGAPHAEGEIPKLELPGSIQDVISSRIDRLDPGAKRVLQIASVIGCEFDRALLEAVADSPDLGAWLEELERVEFLDEKERSGRSEVHLKHPLIQETAYALMTRARRRDLHQRAAEAIEAVLPTWAPGRTAMLAYHHSQGPDPSLAEEHLFRAGDEAARIAAPTEALHFFEQAYESYRAAHGDDVEPGKMALLEKKIATAASNRGDAARATRHFDRALDLMGERVPDGRFAMAIRTLRAVAAVALELYLPASRRNVHPASGEEREIISLMLDRARAQTNSYPTRFFFDCMDGLRKLRRIDPATIERPGIVCAGGVAAFSFTGYSFSIGERFVERGRQLVDARDPRDLILFSFSRFVHKLLAGDWSEEHELPEELVAEGLRLGELWDVTTYLGLLAEKKLYQGRFREADAVLEQIAKIEDLFAFAVAKQNRLGVGAVLRVQQGRLDEARAAIDEYLQLEEISLNVVGLGIRAEIHAFEGDAESARADLARARDLLASSGALVPPFHMVSVRRAEAVLDLGELERARAEGSLALARGRRASRSSRRCLRAARKVAWDGPQSRRMMGTARWLRGRRRSALSWWQSSLDRARALGMKPEMARTYLEVGRRLAAHGGRALRFEGASGDECVERARELFREIGLDVRREQAP